MTAVNRFLFHPGDLCQQAVAAIAIVVGFPSNKPASLALIQPAQQQDHLEMQSPFREVGAPLVIRDIRKAASHTRRYATAPMQESVFSGGT